MIGNEVTIIQADLSMSAALVNLCTQLGYALSQDKMAAQLQEILPRNDHRIYVAKIDDMVRGWAHFYIVDPIISTRYVEVAGLIVDEAFRQQGFGRALLNRGENWAATLGIHKVQLHSNISRKGAHAFYESLGYECIKQQKAFMKVLPSLPG
jgi:GNAT superfamily N-acetyltransferase